MTSIECCCEDEVNTCHKRAVKAKCIGMYNMGFNPFGDATLLSCIDKNDLLNHISLIIKKTDEEIDAELEIVKSSYVPPPPIEPVIEPVKIHYYNLYNALYDQLPIVPVIEEPVVPVAIEEPVVPVVVEEPVEPVIEEPIVPVIEEPIVPVQVVEEQTDNIVV